MSVLSLLILSLIFALSVYGESAPSVYHERLLLRPLPQNALLASFNFRSNASSTSFDQQNFGIFPRSLGQILQHVHTKELHLRFSLGRWDAELWGARPWDGAREGGTGVELWAWVDAESDEEANARWFTLTNALSGLFCASLNFIDSTKTIRPVMTFRPEGHHSDSSLANLHLLHGTLPHEVVCTENLTPFLKLLPCKGKAGISSLFDGHKLFDSSWQSMSIDVRPVCPSDGSVCVLEIEQTVDMVLDIERSKRPRDNPIPRPIPTEELSCDSSKQYHGADSCYPLHKSSEPGWSFAEVFGKPMKGACPLTEQEGPASETVCINAPPDREITVNTSASFTENRYEEGFVRCYKVPTGFDFDLVLPEQELSTQTPLQQPIINAFRGITGHGQERGGVEAVIINPSANAEVEFVYLESLPWFMKPYLHTLQAKVTSYARDSEQIKPIQEVFYRPAVDRHRGSHLELRLVVPPASKLTLSYDFEKAILRYTEYPPDANRGFDAAPAVIRILSSNSTELTARLKASAEKGVYLRTTSLLLPLPTPDFSMPYNVIILTSTVIALGFGSIFNIIVRRFIGADEVPEGKLEHLIGSLRRKVALFKARLTGKVTKTE